MVKSMTGFGRYETTGSGYRASVEIKSVNHRYCDLNIKQPKKFSAFENDIRNIIKQYAARGKIDVFISYEDYSENAFDVRYNPSVAKGYMEAIKRASEEFGIETCISSSMLVKFPDVITLEETGKDEGNAFNIIQDAVHKACVQFVETREREGTNLDNDIKSKLADIKELTKQVEERSPQIVAEYRRKLMEKVAELTSGTKIDEGILATEIIVFADKICVDEETVRLRSHIANMEYTMSENGPAGRKLDFIAQEMNREANTILSKANDATLAGLAVDLKTGIEKIREQIQNIE